MLKGTQTMSKEHTKAPLIDIGIGADERESIVQGLSHLLADSYTR